MSERAMGEPSRHQVGRRGARCQTDGQAGRRGGIGLPEKPIVRRTAGFIQSKDGRTDSPRHCIKMRWRLARRVRLPGLKSAPWLRPGRILCRWHSPPVKGSNGSGAGPVAGVGRLIGVGSTRGEATASASRVALSIATPRWT